MRAGMRNLGVCVVAASVLAVVGGFVSQPLSVSAAARETQAASTSQRIATVDMLVLVERVVLLPKFADAMNAMTNERAKELQQIVDSQAALETQAKDLDQNSDQFKALRDQYLALDSQFKTRQREVQAEIEKLTATQVQQAFTEVLAKVQEAAKQAGYSHVFTSRKADASFRATDFANTLQEVLARNVLLAPQSDDLTESMIDALGVRAIDPMATPATDASAPASATPTNAP